MADVAHKGRVYDCRKRVRTHARNRKHPGTSKSYIDSKLVFRHYEQLPQLSFPKDSESVEPLPDMALLDTKIAEAEAAIAEAPAGPLERKARERRDDLMRLKRVETIYVRALPWQPSPAEPTIRPLLFLCCRVGYWCY